jgi:Nitroreductase
MDSWFLCVLDFNRILKVMKIEEVHQLLRNRKSVYPPSYLDKPIERKVLEELLESANWAPTHKLTEPWRFKVFLGNGRKKLGTFMAEKYRSTTPMDDFSITRYDKLKTNPVKSGAVLAICIQLDDQKRVPEWEELAAVSCAVQNVWLAASAYQIGGYWSTPDIIDHLSELVAMKAGEKCIGLFYMGYYKPFAANRKRSPISEKTTWID